MATLGLSIKAKRPSAEDGPRNLREGEISTAGVKAMFGWSDTQFETARPFLPEATSRMSTGPHGVTLWPVWTTEAITTWHDTLASLFAGGKKR